MASPVTVIKVAEGLIRHPSRWIKGAAAKDEFGGIPRDRDQATCWCASGAVDHAWSLLNGSDYKSLDGAARYLDQAAAKRGFASIVALNDSPSTTHEDIVGVFEEARVIAEQAESATPIPTPSTYFGTVSAY